MKWSEKSEKWVEEYVAAVVAASGARTDEEKEEWARGVRERVMEAVSDRLEDAEVSDAGMADILGEMESPEAYAGGAEGGEKKKWRETGGAKLAAEASRDGKGGWLSGLKQVAGMVLVAACAILGWEWAGFGGCGAGNESAVAAGEDPESTQSEAVHPEPDGRERESAGREVDWMPVPKAERLEFLGMRQRDLSEDNEVTLELRFSHQLEWTELSKGLSLQDETTARPLEYKLAPHDWWWDNDWQWVDGTWAVRVKTSPLAGSRMRMDLAGGLSAAQKGVLPLEEGTNATLKAENDLAAVSFRAYNYSLHGCGVRAEFPLRVDPEELMAHLTIEPKVALTDVEGDSGGVRLTGTFEVGRTYKLKLSEGLRASCGVTLTNEVSGEVTMEAGYRDLALADSLDELLLSTKGSKTLRVRLYGYEGAVTRLRPIREGSLVEWAAHHDAHEWGWDHGWLDDVTRPTVTTTNRLEGDGEAVWTERVAGVDLKTAAGGAELRGLYRVELNGLWTEKREDGSEAEHSSREATAILNVSDIGLHAEWGGHEAVAMANSLRSGRPLAGIEATLWGRGREALATGTTDAEGLVRLKWSPEEEKEHGEPVLLTAKTETDLGYLSLRHDTGEAQTVTTADAEGAYMAEGEEEAYAWTDRGIYRHGETMRVQMLLRGKDGRPAEPHPVEARLVFAREPGKALWKETKLPGATGAADFAVEVKEEWKTGRYRLEMSMPGGGRPLGEAEVQVEDFVPPQVRVDVTEAGPSTDGVARASVRASYLFGREAANLPYTATWSFRAAPFEPKGWTGWTFGDATKEFPRKLRKGDERRLDAEGKAELSRPAEPGWAPPARLVATCEVSVREESGRGARGWAEIPVDVYPRYVGLQAAWGDGPAATGTNLAVRVTQLRPDGSSDETARPLVLQVNRLTWVTAARRTGDGRYEWNSHALRTPVKEGTVEGGAGVREWTFRLDDACEYEVVARDPETGSSASLRFEADGAAAAKGARKKTNDELELEWVRKGDARPGGVAKLRLKPPFAGYAMLTMGDREVRWAKGVDVPEQGCTVDVPVPEGGEVDNYVVSALLVRPVAAEKIWSAHSSHATVALRVARPEKELRVSVKAPSVQKPQKKMTVRVQVKGGDGKPAAGVECSVAAVDEAICMLTGFESPEPSRRLRRTRHPERLWRDDYGKLMTESEASADDAVSAGGDGRGFLRNRLNPIRARRYKPTAMWSGVLTTDEKGVATAEFDIPEFSGELRLMAVAWDAKRTGAAEKRSAVRREVVVRPSFPRFLGCGDAARIPVPVHNLAEEERRVRARLTCAGAVATDVDEREVELQPRESTTLWFTLRAAEGAVGVGTCHLDVEAGKEHYGEDVELAVRPLGMTRTRFASGSLKAGETARWEAPEGWVGASVAADARLSALPGLDAMGAWHYVATYPYGCLEQTISGALPLVTAAEWVKRLGPAGTALADPEAWVRRAISRVQSMQTYQGGFEMWPGIWQSGNGDWSPDTTLYAAEFLAAAREAGYEVDEGAFQRLRKWVAESRGFYAYDSTESHRWRRLIACRIGALIGMNVDGDLNWCDERRDGMDGLELAMLACAMLDAGKPDRAAAVLEEVDVMAGLGGGERGVADSPVRAVAMLLGAWLDLDADAPQVGVLLGTLRGLRGESGHWGNTQNNAMALWALGKAAEHLPQKEQPFKAVLAAADGGRRATVKGKSGSAAWGPGEAAAGVVASNAGPGTVTAVVRFEGVESEPEAPCSRGGLEVSRRFVDLEGRPIDAGELRQGELFIGVVTVKSQRARDNVVVEELLPAGWEVENPNLLTSTSALWSPEESRRGFAAHREIRDDRLLLFVDADERERDYAYTVRAVTPGEYALPGTVAECMYKPEVRAVGESGKVRVTE